MPSIQNTYLLHKVASITHHFQNKFQHKKVPHFILFNEALTLWLPPTLKQIASLAPL